jgi:branched-chain amino acid aminotransferase
MRVAYFNGEFLPEADVRISIEDRAFKYGDMVFDVARTFAGTPFKLERHIERFAESLRYVRIEAPLSPQEFVETSLDVLSRNVHLLGPHDDYWLRQYVTRGIDSLSHRARDAGPPTVLVRCEPIDFGLFAQAYADGVRLQTPSIRRVPPECLDAKAKIGNYVNTIMGELEVPEGLMGLLLDVEGYVAEGMGWNFFVVKDGVVLTPALGSILGGISRETVLELCGELGIPARETRLTLHDVATSDEAFITSTSFCVLPVASTNRVAVRDVVPGPVTTRLTRAWCDLVGVDFVEQARAHLLAPAL